MPNVDKVLAELCQKLGTTADRLWPILVRKTALDWWMTELTFLIACLVSLGVMAYGLRYYRKRCEAFVEHEQKRRERNNESPKCSYCEWQGRPDFESMPGGIIVCAVAGGILAAGFFIAILVNLSMLSTALYPEAATVLRLLGR